MVIMLLVCYPRPYFAAMGGNTLILLMIRVDVVLGPIIVLIVVNPAKKYLRLDLVIIAVAGACEGRSSGCGATV